MRGAEAWCCAGLVAVGLALLAVFVVGKQGSTPTQTQPPSFERAVFESLVAQISLHKLYRSGVFTFTGRDSQWSLGGEARVRLGANGKVESVFFPEVEEAGELAGYLYLPVALSGDRLKRDRNVGVESNTLAADEQNFDSYCTIANPYCRIW